VWAVDPSGDPLGLYLRSIKSLRRYLPEDTLVLSGHQLPFYGAHTRIDELIAHHEIRCAAIEDSCRAAPRSVADLVPVIFHHPLDPHQMSFAFSEVFAHVNYMIGEGRLVWSDPQNGTARIVTP
jgi:glyoxylase-like metal-dependent hydrolase (beta-lactamase superfamily II)